jgi:TonB family protein
MRYSPGIGHEPSLTRLAVTSLIFHVVLLSVLIIPFRTGEREFRSYQVRLLEPGRVSEPEREKAQDTQRAKPRGLKEKKAVVRKRRVAPEKKVFKKREVPAKKGIKEVRPDRDNASERVAREIEKLRAIKGLTREKEEREKTRGIEDIRKRLSARAAVGVGIPGKGENRDPNSYYAVITRKIWDEWSCPPDLCPEKFEVIISIKIDSSGKVVTHTIEKTSGNALVDHSAVKAISKASPLPPPPVEMEVGIRFYL